MAVTVLAWYAGFMIGYTVGYVLEQQQVPWRIVLGSSTIIAVVLLIARIGLPELPRWLWTERRFDEAHAIAHKYLVDASEMTDVDTRTPTGRLRDAVLPAVLVDDGVCVVVLVLRRPALFRDRDVRRRCVEAVRPGRRLAGSVGVSMVAVARFPVAVALIDKAGRRCSQCHRSGSSASFFFVESTWLGSAPPGPGAGSVPALLVS